MSAKFVAFINPHDKKPMLINPAHVGTASESGPNKVTLVMGTWQGGGFRPDGEGNLKFVWETLTRTPVDLTWTSGGQSGGR
jgi:hypothetical protein